MEYLCDDLPFTIYFQQIVEVSKCNPMSVLQHNAHRSGGSLNAEHINMGFRFRSRTELVYSTIQRFDRAVIKLATQIAMHQSIFRESRLHNLTLSCPAAFGVLVYHVDYSLIAIFRVTEAITAGVIALLLIIYIRLYNRLRRLFIKVKEGNVSINVALEKRYDLLPQELEAVQKYLQHEHQVYTEVTALRTGKDLDEAAFLQKRSFFTFPS